jgi:hypothetical protein
VPKNGVSFRGFDHNGKLLIEQFLSTHEWYDGNIPLIDDADESRSHYRIAMIEGEVYDLAGNIDSRWRNHYNKNGTLIATETWVDSAEGGSWVRTEL